MAVFITLGYFTNKFIKKDQKIQLFSAIDGAKLTEVSTVAESKDIFEKYKKYKIAGVASSSYLSQDENSDEVAVTYLRVSIDDSESSLNRWVPKKNDSVKE